MIYNPRYEISYITAMHKMRKCAESTDDFIFFLFFITIAAIQCNNSDCCASLGWDIFFTIQCPSFLIYNFIVNAA